MKKGILVIIILGLLGNQSCKPDERVPSDCFIPNVAVSITLNMDLPEYYALRNIGEYKEFNAGNKGVYVIHNYDDIYYAIERTCTYNPDEECSQVFLDKGNLQFKCGQMADTGFVQCCASTYSLNSAFLSGPTQCNLKTYRISRSGNTLYVGN